jgi:hypothetical protein
MATLLIEGRIDEGDERGKSLVASRFGENNLKPTSLPEFPRSNTIKQVVFGSSDSTLSILNHSPLEES